MAKRLLNRIDDDYPAVAFIMAVSAMLTIVIILSIYFVLEVLWEVAREEPRARASKSWLEGPHEEDGALSLDDASHRHKRGRLSVE